MKKFWIIVFAFEVSPGRYTYHNKVSDISPVEWLIKVKEGKVDTYYTLLWAMPLSDDDAKLALKLYDPT